MSQNSRGFQFDVKNARTLLEIIDAPEARFLFAFKQDGRRCSPRMAYGTLDEISLLIQRAIYRRLGIFAAVQDQGDRRGEANLRRVRAVFGEFDQPPAAPLPMEPSAVVASGGPGKTHVHFAVDPSDPLTGDEAKQILNTIVVRYGADPQAKDNARILRLPGTWNFKPEYRVPQPVRLLEASGMLYGRRKLLEAFPPMEPKSQRPIDRSRWRSNMCDADCRRAERYLCATLDRITKDIETAPGGMQWATFGSGSWRIAGLIASAREHDALPTGFERHARAALIAAGRAMENTRPQEPWTATQLARELDRALERAPAAQNVPWSRA